jgi:hypothetical protein
MAHVNADVKAIVDRAPPLTEAQLAAIKAVIYGKPSAKRAGNA